MKQVRKVVVAAGAVGFVVLVATATYAGSAAGRNDDADAEVPATEASPVSSEAFAAERAKSQLVLEAGDRERIDAAAESFAKVLASDPGSKSDFLVSFATPVPMDAVQHLSGLTAVYPWVMAPGAPNPIWGQERLPKALQGEISDTWAKQVTDGYIKYLTDRVTKVEKSEVQEPNDGPARDAQVKQLQFMIDSIQQDGLQVFGVSCECSADELAKLGAEYHVLMVEADREDGTYPLVPQGGE